MKNAKEYLEFIVNKIHTAVVATTDENGLPVTCVIDMMYCDENGLYFLTAKGKGFYHRLQSKKYLSLSCVKGNGTMNSAAISIRGKVREVGSEMLEKLLTLNPYMKEIYPTEQSRKALAVFNIYEGSGEWFDLSKKPIERDSFSFGNAEKVRHGYFITDKCTSCGICLEVCPTQCISADDRFIYENHCLCCGNCMTVCPVGAVERQ